MSKTYVTLGWDGQPTTTKGDGYILPRRAEMIINSKYYPNNKVGEWPLDPETGTQLEIEPYKPHIKPQILLRIKTGLKSIIKYINE